jgi:hypothetical protein
MKSSCPLKRCTNTSERVDTPGKGHSGVAKAQSHQTGNSEKIFFLEEFLEQKNRGFYSRVWIFSTREANRQAVLHGVPGTGSPIPLLPWSRSGIVNIDPSNQITSLLDKMGFDPVRPSLLRTYLFTGPLSVPLWHSTNCRKKYFLFLEPKVLQTPQLSNIA